MTRITSALPTPTSTPEEQKLRAATKQLEGVFVQELFKAMRETIPQAGLTDGGAGENIFTGLMDEKIAIQVPEQWAHGLGESLYRQLRAALPHENHGPAPADADDKRIK